VSAGTAYRSSLRKYSSTSTICEGADQRPRTYSRDALFRKIKPH
jgi:hypothetical protein